MSTIISVEHISKTYHLGQIGTGTFSRDLEIWWAKLRSKPNPLMRIGEKDHGNRNGEELWALRDVSFTVEQGEVLGIIGRNGAGKSTLLKILSRVTAPTSGRIKVKGRIASLLEVGTGFHPELTGRENIYLNGAILGMSRREIERKFDEIVDFAEVEKFIDTPVKRYSSGMYVRLAFAVAAHLEPEILVVDEVLAVGDAAFQKKCLGKMGDVAREGRTVLFVSHNMGAVVKLCETGIVLEQGSIVKQEGINEAVSQYAKLMQVNDEVLHDYKDIWLKGFCVESDNEFIDTSKELPIKFTLKLGQAFWKVKIMLVIRNADQVLLVREVIESKEFPKLCSEGTFLVKICLPPLWFSSGQYSCHIKIFADLLDKQQRYVSNPLTITVVTDKKSEDSEILSPRPSWTFQSL